MGGASHFLEDLVTVLGVAAVVTVVFQRLRQPVALGYILAGVLIGPYFTLFPLVANRSLVSTLSDLGVILLMFSIGIEFSIRKIARIGFGAAMTAFIEVGMMVSIGYLTGFLLGWTATEALFLGAALGISSTMLVARTFDEQGLRDAFTEVVFAILVFEDMIAILLLAILSGVASGAGMSPEKLAATIGKLAGFLIAMLAIGLFVVPRFIRFVAKLGRPETLLVASIGVCFGMALVAEEAGYSVALGAFLAGMLVSESGVGAKVEHLISPFRDLFAAIFFVAVGMTIDPRIIAEHWLTVVILSVVVIVGKVTGVSIGAFLSGNGLRRSVRAGMSLAQIGELSFIIAALGISSGATRTFLLPVAVAVSCVTAVLTPFLVRVSDRASGFVDAHLPRRLQTFVTFYDSWVEGLRKAPSRDSLARRIRGHVLVLLLDATLLGATVIAAATVKVKLIEGIPEIAVTIAASVLAGVFLIGFVRRAHRLGREIATVVLPAQAPGKVDLGGAPRRAFALTLELLIVLVVGIPLAAIIQPFVPLGPAVLIVVLVMIGFTVWRSISSFQGHLRAGSELIVEALARQTDRKEKKPSLDQVKAMLPGVEGLTPLEIDARSPAVGKSLAELNLRALTGASVLAITRGGEGQVFPPPTAILAAGDVLALAGPEEAIRAADELLRLPPQAGLRPQASGLRDSESEA